MCLTQYKSCMCSCHNIFWCYAVIQANSDLAPKPCQLHQSHILINPTFIPLFWGRPLWSRTIGWEHIQQMWEHDYVLTTCIYVKSSFLKSFYCYYDHIWHMLKNTSTVIKYNHSCCTYELNIRKLLCSNDFHLFYNLDLFSFYC